MNFQRASSFLFILSFLVLGIASAQLGEVAGPVSFNVNISSSQTIQLNVINSGSSPISYKVILPQLVAQQVNSTAPNITSSTPLVGTIMPYTQFPINLTVYMPSGNNKPGYSWSGVVQVIETTNQTQAGGAVVQSGVAKIISISAAQPKPLNPLIYVGGIIIIAIIAAFAYKKVILSKKAAGKGATMPTSLYIRSKNGRISSSKPKKTRNKAKKQRKRVTSAKKKAPRKRR